MQSRGSFKFKESAIPLDLKGWAKTCIRGGVPLKSLALVSLSDRPFLQPKAFFLILMDQKYLCCLFYFNALYRSTLGNGKKHKQIIGILSNA